MKIDAGKYKCSCFFLSVDMTNGWSIVSYCHD